MKVLLVEDSPIAQKIATLHLKTLRCEIDLAETGAVALKKASGYRYDVIFMDIGLPDIDGITVTENIRSDFGINLATPIVAVTANDDQDTIEHCLKEGIDNIVSKPLTKEKCLAILSSL